MMALSQFEEFCGGPFWNETLTWGLNTSWPQFTKCFQNTALVWVPCGWLWVTLPLYLYYLITRREQPLTLAWLNIAKTLCGVLLLLLAVVEIMEAAGKMDITGKVPTVHYVTPSVKAATLLLSTILIQLERKCGFITSGVQFMFYFLLTFGGIIPFYSYIILKDSNVTEYAIFYLEFGIILIQFLLHWRAEPLPLRYYMASDKMPCPEISASFLSRMTYWWINGLVLTGYKKSLEESDLWDMNPRDKGANFIPQFETAWSTEMTRCRTLAQMQQKHFDSKRIHRNPNFAATERTPLLSGSSMSEEVAFKGAKQQDKCSKGKASLVKILAKTFGSTLLISFACKMSYDLIQFISPVILRQLIDFTENPSIQMWKGYIFALGLFVTALVQSVFYHQSFMICMTLGMRVKAAIIAAVYKKALTMNSEARKTSTVGEIVNLMSVDAQRIGDITGYLYMLWSSPLIIGVALYLLYGTMGSSIFAGLAVMVLMIPVAGVISVKTRKLQMKQMELKDSRIKMMTEVLNGIKVLKLYAWELSFQQKILAIRNKELDVLRKAANLAASNTFLWTTAPYLVTLATFATYILSSSENRLDASKAFVALSLFNILRFPINMLPMIVSFLVQGQVSISRLNKFLQHGDLDMDCVQHDSHSADPITVEGGTFTWDRSETTTLRGINLKIPDGQLLAVVGPVGAGKSSLISALIGEMEKTEGSVSVRGSVAYVAQEAWIQNATLKDNILFGKDCKDDEYKKIVEACALGPDLEMLPGGDMTEIGEKGINVSGGQKQRVALARAVYNDADIYLLDDPLSAVDAHVGKHIFEQVVGAKGLLKNKSYGEGRLYKHIFEQVVGTKGQLKNKTRVLVTHGIHWLPMVDQIAVITNGVISEIGSYEELMSHDGAFAHFIHTYLTQEAETSDDDDDPEVAELKSRMLERADSVLSGGEVAYGDHDKTVDTLSDGDQANKTRLRRLRSRKISGRTSDSSEPEAQSRESKKKLRRGTSTVDIPEKKKVDTVGDKLIEEEKSEIGKVQLSVYAAYAKAIGFWISMVILLFYALTQGLNVYSSIWLSVWTEDATLKETTHANTSEYQDKNNMYLGVYGGLGLGQAMCVLTYALVFAKAQVKAASALHVRMLANILRSPMSFFDTTPIGRIVNRFSRDVETIDNNLPQIIGMFLMCVFGVVSTLVVISFSTPIFLSVIVPLGILYYFIQRFYIPTSRQMKRIESTTRSPIYSHFSETVTGASTIRAYRQQDRFIEESLTKVDRNLLFYFAGNTSNRWLGFRLEVVGNLIVFAATVFAVVYRDTLSGGLVGLSISYALQITASLNWMVRMTSDLETNIVSVERVKEYSETLTEAEWYLPNHRPHRDWPPTGVLEFQDYTTRYRPGLDLVLKGITCNINGGEKIGIVGRTGAGKSSLTLAIFRIIEAASGSIVIDGVRIGDIGLHDLRSKLTILPQDPVLFSGSLRMNLDPFDWYSDDQIWQALEHSHLKSYVESLTAGLEHECGEGGQNLSVGQRQLVCLARTLLRKTKILILDEATAAVDMETDDLIQKTIRTEFKDCTVVTIAHRLNTIMDYDRILVLDQGVIREMGTPGELLQDRQGVFYGMAKDAGLA